MLQRQPYLAGAQFSVADITTFAALIHGDFSGVAIPQDCVALLAWRAKVAERPGVKNRSGQSLDADDLRRLGF